ncbi:MAG: hypothetical protein RLZZ165_1090 [Bacteroidota bacterium]|jgi:lysophospholipase L1-like esterase
MESGTLKPIGVHGAILRALLWSGLLLIICYACTTVAGRGGGDAAPDALAPGQQPASGREARRQAPLLTFPEGAQGGIVFAGSSSIRKWESLQADMAPLPVTNCGIGGAIIRQVTRTSGSMIVPLRPRLIVLYCGENDIASGKYPAGVLLDDFKAFVKTLRSDLPMTGILFVSLKPSPIRWKHWPRFQEANRLIQDYVRTEDRMWYVDVSQKMLGEDGRPLREIYMSDSLHMNAAGYRIWTEILKPEVATRFGQLAGN